MTLSRKNYEALIYITVFWGGFFIMGIELLSGKILAPYFGSSIFVWGGILTIFMLSLSLGYLKGGQFSLKNPSLDRLSLILIASAILALPIVTIESQLLTWVSSIFSDPRYGSLLASTLLFAGTTGIAGMISPYAIRLLISQVESSGKSAGTLYFLSTLGSAAGTLLTSFYFVLWFDIENIIKGFIIISMMIGSMLFLADSSRNNRIRSKLKPSLYFILFPILFFIPSLVFHFLSKENQQKNIIHTEKSAYRNITVWEQKMRRCLIFKEMRGRQSCIDLNAPNKIIFPYIHHMLGTLFLNPNPKRVLVIGLGGGTLPKALRLLYPKLIIDVVEIDPSIIKVAKHYFAFKEDPLLHIFADDGRVFIKKSQQSHVQYDILFLDAFGNQYIPEHLLTKEFLLEAKSILSEKGIISANTYSSSLLYHYETATYQSVFGPHYNLHSTKSGNRVIIASKAVLPELKTIYKTAEAFRELFQTMGFSSSETAALFTITPLEKETYVLTDQHSPSNLLNVPQVH